MKRKIIRIDEEKCSGCGLCAAACHEGAIGIINGKATLLREDYCDGMGDCLPECPTGAITFEEREAAAYDAAAVLANKQRQAAVHTSHGCPGSQMRQMTPEPAAAAQAPRSQLRQWPVQIKLVPANAPYFQGAELLIAADCTAFAYGNFHQELMRGKIVLAGCPKLDGVDYTGKLSEIIGGSDIQSVTVVRMEVPCCGGLEMAAKAALQNSGKSISWQVITISIDGRILR